MGSLVVDCPFAPLPIAIKRTAERIYLIRWIDRFNESYLRLGFSFPVVEGRDFPAGLQSYPFESYMTDA
jgi:hypothetical protein